MVKFLRPSQVEVLIEDTFTGMHFDEIMRSVDTLMDVPVKDPETNLREIFVSIAGDEVMYSLRDYIIVGEETEARVRKMELSQETVDRYISYRKHLMSK